MKYEDIKRWCHSELMAPADSDMHRRAEAILAAIKVASAPPWLPEAAEALGDVRPDGAPLALNWEQVVSAIRAMRMERDKWREKAEAAEKRLKKVQEVVAAARHLVDGWKP